MRILRTIYIDPHWVEKGARTSFTAVAVSAQVLDVSVAGSDVAKAEGDVGLATLDPAMLDGRGSAR